MPILNTSVHLTNECIFHNCKPTHLDSTNECSIHGEFNTNLTRLYIYDEAIRFGLLVHLLKRIRGKAHIQMLNESAERSTFVSNCPNVLPPMNEDLIYSCI